MNDLRLAATAVASIVELQFPELSPAGAVYLGEGCDSYAFDVNRRWVFRFPKRAGRPEYIKAGTRALVLCLGGSTPFL